MSRLAGEIFLHESSHFGGVGSSQPTFFVSVRVVGIVDAVVNVVRSMRIKNETQLTQYIHNEDLIATVLVHRLVYTLWAEHRSLHYYSVSLFILVHPCAHVYMEYMENSQCLCSASIFFLSRSARTFAYGAKNKVSTALQVVHIADVHRMNSENSEKIKWKWTQMELCNNGNGSCIQYTWYVYSVCMSMSSLSNQSPRKLHFFAAHPNQHRETLWTVREREL